MSKALSYLKIPCCDYGISFKTFYLLLISVHGFGLLCRKHSSNAHVKVLWKVRGPVNLGWSGSKPDFLLLFEWSPLLVLSIGLFFVAVQFFQESCELLLVSSARLVVFWVPSGVRGLRAIISMGTLTLPFCSHLDHCPHLIPLLQSKACGLQQSPRPKTWCYALNLIIRRGKFLSVTR